MSSTITFEPVSDDPTLDQLISAAIEAYVREEINTVIPGRVEAYDASKQRADVKPLVQDRIPTRDGREILESYPVVRNVPVAWLRAGGYLMTMPLAKGDFVLLVAAQRSIDQWVNGDGGERDPGGFRMHDLSDAVAFPCVYPVKKALGDSDVKGHMVLGREGGKAQIHIKADEVDLYEENAADFVALAQKVLDELNAVKTDFEAFKTAYDSHVHITTATVGAGPVGTLSPTVSTAPTPHTPASVAAAKVKAT